MTQAFGRIEDGAPVQQAAIVEHQQIAGLQQKADLEIRRAQAVVEQLPRPVVGVEALGANSGTKSSRGLKWMALRSPPRSSSMSGALAVSSTSTSRYLNRT